MDSSELFCPILSPKPSTIVRFFDRGDYYTVHDDDATLAAKLIFHTQGVIKTANKPNSGNEKGRYVVLSNKNFRALARELLVIRQYRIEVYRRSENVWKVDAKGSPGNLSQLEELVFVDDDVGNIQRLGVVAVHIKRSGLSGRPMVGAAYCNTTQRNISVTQFEDSDHLTNLETLLVQLSPAECVGVGDAVDLNVSNKMDVSSNDDGEGPGGNIMLKVCKRSGLPFTPLKKSSFNTKDLVQDLAHILHSSRAGESAAPQSLPELYLDSATPCIAALLSYLNLCNDKSNHHSYTLSQHHLSQFMRLDQACMQALHILPTGQDNNKARTRSIYGLLNRCKTGPGSRLLARWLQQPLTDAVKIKERLDVVESLVSNPGVCQTLSQDYLSRVGDLERLTRKFRTHAANLSHCYQVYVTTGQVEGLVSTLQEICGKHSQLINQIYVTPFQDLMRDFQKFRELVQTTVDLERAERDQEFVIRAEFDPDLKALRGRMDELEGDMKNELSKVVKDLHVEPGKVVKLEWSGVGGGADGGGIGWHFRVTRKDEKLIRNNKSYQVIDTQQKGVKFMTQPMRKLSSAHSAASTSYVQQQRGVAQEVISVACGYTEPMTVLSDLLATLDVLVAFAITAADAPVPYTRPEVLEKGSGIIKFTELRHPLVELAADSSTFIPNDVNLIRCKDMGKEDDAMDTSNTSEGARPFYVITGPNMGGKSTYLRSVGVSVLLSHIGMYVPASSGVVSVTDSLWTRAGAHDALLKGVSTFMMEMVETAGILRHATEHSLVLIDELGRGTSTYDGFGLAWSLAHHLANEVQCLTLFATHFHELTQLSEVLPLHVGNLHVQALTSERELTLLYKVVSGVCDQSFGLHVARLVGFPQYVIDLAEEKANELEVRQDVEEKSPIKKKRLSDKQAGEKLLQEFLEKVKCLDVSVLSDEEITGKVETLKKELMASSNTYISHILST